MALEPITRQEKIIAGQDLTPITRMEKFLKQYGGGSGGVTSWNDLTDKPFGEVTTVKEVLAECQPEMVATEEGFSVGVLDGLAPIAVGETYIVSLNGTDYKVTTQATSELDIVFGNLSLAGMEDTGEPFFASIAMIEDEAGTYYSGEIFVLDGSTTLTISIRQEVTEVKKISGKYVEGMGWSEASYKEVLAEQAIAFERQDFNYSYSLETPLGIAVGDKCKVTFDGVSYDCVAYDHEGEIWFGNGEMRLSDGGNGEPFLVDEWAIYVQHSGEEATVTHTVSIHTEAETIHPIDPKFLPVTTFYAPYSSDGGVRLCDESGNEITYEQAKAAIDTMVRIWVENQGGYMYPICVADRADETHVEFCCVSFSAGLSSAIFIGGEPTGGGGGPV